MATKRAGALRCPPQVGLLIEWDNTQRDANHAHSVWRNPGSDLGLDVLARHRTAHHA